VKLLQPLKGELLTADVHILCIQQLSYWHYEMMMAISS